MKILAVQGSHNLKGNTATLLDAWLEGAREAGHTIERIDLVRLKLNPCIGCNACRPQGKGSGQCVFKDDMPIAAAQQCGVLVMASPVFWWNFNATTRIFLDRLYCLPFNVWHTKKVKHIVTLFHPVPSMISQSLPLVWNYMSSYMKFEYLGLLEGSSGTRPISQQPELLAYARNQGFELS